MNNALKTLAACFLLELVTHPLAAQVPNLVSHQGRVAVNGVNFDGSGRFKFALVNANGSTTYWSNAPDNTPADGEPDAAVSLPVTKGLYSVMLGEGMTPVPAAVFQNPDLRLRVWFNDGTHGFQLLNTDQRLAPNGYLPAGAVSAGSLADGSITSAKIATGTVVPSQAVADTTHTMEPNTSYVATGASLTTFTLPSSASIGDVVQITGTGSGGWSVTSPSGQSIVGPWIPRETARRWRSVASSADGTKLVAVVFDGQIYTSTDSGISWTPRESVRNWRSVASSADGTKLVAVTSGSGGQIYTTSDSGATWTPHPTMTSSWVSVASSADGTKLVVVDNQYPYTSNDSGVTWTQRQTEFGSLRSVASSADGSKLVASVNQGFVDNDGQIYTSTDSGVTWTPRESNRDWTCVASSADGNKLVAVVDGGQIYTSATVGGMQGQSAVLQYLGSGEWTQVGITGNGAGLTGINANHLIGSVPSASLTSVPAESLTGSVPASSLTSVPAGSLTGSIPATALGAVPAENLTGSVPPATLTSVPATSLNGAIPPDSLISVPAASLTGTISDAQLSSNVPLRAGGNSFTGNQTVMGNVGIGTASPGQMLQVGDVNTGNSLGMMRFASRSGAGPANRYWDIGVPQAGENAAGKYYSFVIDDPQLSMEPEVVVRFDTGNMGIGITSPASKLHVNGTVTATAFNPPSDRNLKENFEPVDAREVLEKVAAIPIRRWNFIGDAGTPHIGPMAQDFHAAFGTGTDDRHIATVDADGVALAAIQGLNEKLTEALTAKETEIAALKSETGALREKNQAMEARLAALEALLNRQQAARSKPHSIPSAP